jgi:hypothetical protein
MARGTVIDTDGHVVEPWNLRERRTIRRRGMSVHHA